MAAGDLPAGPLRWWLNQQAERFGDGLNDRDLAEFFGLDERRMRVLRWGGQATVTLGVVDRLMTKAGEPHMLAILYPLDEPAADLDGPTRPDRQAIRQQRHCRVRELHRQGFNVTEIANRTQSGQATISRDLVAMGLQVHPRRRRKHWKDRGAFA